MKEERLHADGQQFHGRHVSADGQRDGRGAGGAGGERNGHAVADAGGWPTNLVTRKEFGAVRAMALKALKDNEPLRARIEELEKSDG